MPQIHFNGISSLLFVLALFSSNMPNGETKALVIANCYLSDDWIDCSNIGNVTSFSLDNYTDPVAGPRSGIYVSDLPPTRDEDRANFSGLSHLPGNAFRGLEVSWRFFTQRFLSYYSCLHVYTKRANVRIMYVHCTYKPEHTDLLRKTFGIKVFWTYGSVRTIYVHRRTYDVRT